MEDLRRVAFLAPLKERDLKHLLQTMTERRVGPGEDIITEGESAIAFFVMLEGDAAVLIGGREVHRLGPGEHFGEIALVLPDVPRTATVRAQTPVRVAVVGRWNFKAFVGEHPEVHWPLVVSLAQQLAARAR
jgi:CRP-like cAMP-binding protein